MGRRNNETAAPARAAPLEGTQESNQLVLLCGAEVVEIVRYRLSFATMALDGVVESGRAAVVQQLRARSNTPKRRRAHFERFPGRRFARCRHQCQRYAAESRCMDE